MRSPLSTHSGAVLLLTFLLLLVLTGLVTAVGLYANHSLATARSQRLDRQALYIAEAGWQRARQALAASTWTGAVAPGNDYTESFGGGEYVVNVTAENACIASCNYTVTSSSYVPNQTAVLARRRITEVDAPVTIVTGTNFSLAATASASSSTGANTPNKANDGNSATKWQSGTNGNTSWLAMDYGSSATLNRIVVDEDSNIGGITVDYSDNGSVWTSISGATVTQSPSKKWNATFSPISHRYFRANLTGVGANKKAAVEEMRSYNTTISLSTGDIISQW